MDFADRRSEVFPKERVDHLQRRLTAAVTLLERLKVIEGQLPDAPDKQISMTDPDARAMATSGKGTGLVGYNVQTTVDDQHHLIVAHEVRMEGHDRYALAPMTEQGQAVTGPRVDCECVCRSATPWCDAGYECRNLLDLNQST